MKIGGIFLAGTLVVLFASCGKHEDNASNATFTHVDSLTETYLLLQDSMLHTWNVMAKDENEKLQNIDILLGKILKNDFYDQEQVQSLQERLQQLERIRFSQKTMINPHVVEEYDFASNSLITEIISLVESDPGFIKNQELQQLTDLIKLADQRVSTYREEYDEVVVLFNDLILKNRADLIQIDKSWESEPRPTFSDQEEKQGS